MKQESEWRLPCFQRESPCTSFISVACCHPWPLDTTGSALSPWRLYLQQKACSRHNSQTKEGTLELGRYQETGLAIRREVAATQGTQPTGPPGLMGLGPQGQPLPCFPRRCGASPDAFSSVDADRCCASIFYTRASAWRGR